MIVGDNIYHFDKAANEWQQADSHHSNADGSINRDNVARDTKSNSVLVSQHFYYFGSQAPTVPSHLLDEIGYKNVRSHRVFEYTETAHLVDWLQNSFSQSLNQIIGDPFDFDKSQKRYSAGNNKIT